MVSNFGTEGQVDPECDFELKIDAANAAMASRRQAVPIDASSCRGGAGRN
jgi:hypothetical protein